MTSVVPIEDVALGIDQENGEVGDGLNEKAEEIFLAGQVASPIRLLRHVFLHGLCPEMSERRLKMHGGSNQSE
jgi:hypothetical protein